MLKNNMSICIIYWKVTRIFSSFSLQPARNNILKNFPNASSESDLSRCHTRLPGRDRKSPSLSNLTADGIRHKVSEERDSVGVRREVVRWE